MRTLQSRLALASVLTAFLAGCSSQPAEEPRRGKTADERPVRVYSGPGACALETEIVLAQQVGSPASQAVCGLLNPAPTTAPTNVPLYVYLGIPYADPPTGPTPTNANRWTDPRAPTFQEIPATVYGPRCPQGKGKNIAQDDVNEDCLYLNVWTPEITPSGGGDLPVMVFIHGGAFISGSGGSAIGQGAGQLNLYDGSQFVAASRAGGGPGVVFVTMNYRLGVLGFLAGDKLGPSGLSGNFGIKDQTAALQWVRRNVSLFGGDPDNVTIFGESAGAQSTALHLTMPGDQGLFARAVMESNYAIDYQTVPDAQAKANIFSVATGCTGFEQAATDVACLRGLSLETVLKSQTAAWTVHDLKCQGLQAIIPWNPVIDGTVITTDPILAPVTKPFMLGTNRNESIPFIAWMGKGGIAPNVGFTTEAEWGTAYAGLMLGLFGEDDARKIVAEYAIYQLENGSQATLQTVVTDYLWTCFNRNFASTGPHAGVASFRYHDVHFPSFANWVDPTTGLVSGPVDTQCNTSPNVCHGNELSFVFGNATNTNSKAQSFTPGEAIMSSQLQNYWIQFARTSHPSDPAHPFTPGQTAWPLDATGQLIQFEVPPTGMTILSDATFERNARCSALWDGIGYVVKSAAANTPSCNPVTGP